MTVARHPAHIAVVLALLAGLLVLAPTQADAGAPTTLVINEVDYTGGVQIVELYNPTSGAIQTGGLVIDGNTDDSTFPQVGNISIPSGGYAAVCMNGANHADCDLLSNEPLATGAGSVTLLNSSLTELDRVGWQGGPGEGNTGNLLDTGTGKSLSRCADGADTDSNAADVRRTTPTYGTANFCPALLVNEVDYIGNSLIEIRNASAQPLDLGDYTIGWTSAGGLAAQGYAAGTTLAAGAVRTVTPSGGNALRQGAGGVRVQATTGQVTDRLTWGGGADGYTPEGQDTRILDPDAGPSPTNGHSISRCGTDTDNNTADFYGLTATPGAPNACPTVVFNEVDYDTGAGEVEFIELVNTGTTSVDLFDLEVWIANGGEIDIVQVDTRPSTLAAGGRATICLSSATGCTLTLTSSGITIDDTAGGVALISRWSTAGVDVMTWEGGGLLAGAEPGSSTTGLADPGAGMGLSRCPDSSATSGTATAFMVSALTRNAANTCTAAAPPALVINEVAYRGTGEFVELYNGTGEAVDLTGYDLIIDPTPDGRQQVVLNGSIAAGDHRTICLNNTACDQDVAGTTLPDTPSGIALRDPDQTVLDVLSWGNGGIAPDTQAEGPATTSLVDPGDPAGNSLSRCPDGTDTDSNVADFALQARSLGVANPCTGPVGATAEGQVTIPTTDATATSIAFSQLLFPDEGTRAGTRGASGPTEVLLASDTVFADALASGSLQATRPLLLNDRDTLEPTVLAEIQRLGATTVRILGGTAAIDDPVITALQGEGLTVTRTFGPTRLETAEQIAQLTTSPSSVILGRAFPAAGGDDTQAFADTLAAGGWAAASGQPILLSQTEVLSTTTDTYLDASTSLTTVRLVGGEAALSQAVVDRLGGIGVASSRTSGATRFATAVAIATARGYTASSPASTVILVEGQAANAWEAGFTAAGTAAAMDAPVVLANGDSLPAETTTFLQESVSPGGDGPTLICAAAAAACTAARTALGL